MVLIEVLSKSTEAYDRGKKFEHYRTVESLSDYLLIAQDRAKVEHFTRQPNNFWMLSESHGLEDTIEIASISCTLPLLEVYDKVGLTNPEEKEMTNERDE
jgi:Uma2 family endonuclease